MSATWQIRRDIEAVITGLTRNQFESNLTWVRIPPCPPEQNGHPARGGRFVLAVFSRIRTGAVVNGVPGALQSRDPACSAEQVESCTLRQISTVILIQSHGALLISKSLEIPTSSRLSAIMCSPAEIIPAGSFCYIMVERQNL